jgi:acid phosphatase family membrane protein YuiD
VSLLLQNKLLIAAVLALVLAQFAKGLVALVTERRFDFRYIAGAGGMPSSHSAFVTALATSAGRVDGLNSAAFAISVVLAAIVMYDAAGVRRAVSVQARILNQMMEDYFHNKGIKQEKLRELVGHTPFQVFVGAILGFVVALLLTL